MSTLPFDADLARLAADMYRGRQARAQETVRNRGMSLHQAQALLRPWLAIACLCRAELPELAEPLAELVSTDVDGTPIVSEAAARGLVAMDICPRAQWAPVLTAARDAALDALPASCLLDDPRFVDALALTRVANHLAFDPNGKHPIKPYIPGTTAAQRKAA